MMPDIDPRKERVRLRARVAMSITAVAMTVFLLAQPGWQWVQQWVPLAFVMAVAVLSLIAGSGELPSGRGRGSRGSRGRGSGLSGRGRDLDNGPAGATAHQLHTLAMVSRLMPRSAGRRWLSEAESVLSEIEPAWRVAAIRSYLVSAAGLVVMMWARELQRRARLGPRRPG